MTAQVKTIIFDLSEVLIAGLLGIENELAIRCETSPKNVLAHLGGDHLWQFCRGKLSEEEYLDHTCRLASWTLPRDELKQIIRRNFARKIPGTEALLLELAVSYDVVLLSDHGREWVEHIRGIHPFLVCFSSCHFSFELGAIKAEPATFAALLSKIGRTPAECLLIDDSARNVKTAESIGIAAIQFSTAAQLDAELRQRGFLHAPTAGA